MSSWVVTSINSVSHWFDSVWIQTPGPSTWEVLNSTDTATASSESVVIRFQKEREGLNVEMPENCNFGWVSTAVGGRCTEQTAF